MPALQNRPKLSQWVFEYWEAFQILSGSRAVHEGAVGPIPLSEMIAYMTAIYLRDVDDRLKFITMIQSLDSVYMKHVNEKAKQRADAQRKSRSKTRM